MSVVVVEVSGVVCTVKHFVIATIAATNVVHETWVSVQT